jgi:hypothetical protein
MMEQITSYADCGRRNGIRVDEERGHGEGIGRDNRQRYSKKVFILSKKPSPSSSIDMPLSLANSVSNSF